MLKETTLAYLAGLVDGEGSISFQRPARGRPLQLELEVKMTTPEPIELLSQTFGGTIYTRPPPKGFDHHLKQYRWRVRGSKALMVYDLLRPYLLVKKVP